MLTRTGSALSKFGRRVGATIKGIFKSSDEAASNSNTLQRIMSNAELKATEDTGLLRGGREGENFFTNSASNDAKRAQQRLGLDGPLRTDKIEFKITDPNIEVSGPRIAKPGQSGTPGGGTEFSTNQRTPIEIIKKSKLKTSEN